ncbi:hypothetical protein G6L73_30855 [Agrobacterium rhizogenes]|nr:hypothetical protein [Rhizobium rhizogenes]NTH35896.1 hypothetical protein [Rhizobium rhizogenes]
MKVDVLALGTLTCLRKAFRLIEAHKGIPIDLVTIEHEDQATHTMIRKADALGSFLIESRAQMAMLPRIKPRTLYDLVYRETAAFVICSPKAGVEEVAKFLRERERLMTRSHW